MDESHLMFVNIEHSEITPDVGIVGKSSEGNWLMAPNNLLKYMAPWEHAGLTLELSALF